MPAVQMKIENHFIPKSTETGRFNSSMGVREEWEHFHLPTGTGLRGWGRSVEHAFEETARSLTALFADPAVMQPSEFMEFACGASTKEDLLLEFLNLLIYSIKAQNMYFSNFEIKIKGNCLKVKARGQKLNITSEGAPITRSYRLPKSVSIGQRRKDGLWFAECAVDVKRKEAVVSVGDKGDQI